MSTLSTAEVEAAYRYCRRLNARHGKTFYLATLLLPPNKRRHVHALYGFARYADDVVDKPEPGPAPVRRLQSLREEVGDALTGGRAHHPVVRALCATMRQYDVDSHYVFDFLDSMAADLTVTRYPTFADLDRYMWGSASVIGLQLLPILGVVDDLTIAQAHASQLGVAFQLTNFIRDIGEDYRRGRIYLPLHSLAEHDVTPAMLGAQTSTPQLQSLIAAEIERARSFYRRAAPGIEMLHPSSRDCVRTAAVLYSDILTEIERNEYRVLEKRAVVKRSRRLIIGAKGYLRALRAR